jgi:DNA-binding MarR family transcriptional regulator
MTLSEQTTDQYLELLEGFVRLRPAWVMPEHLAHFKEKMVALHEGGWDNPEDLPFLFRVFLVLASGDTPPTMGELCAALGIPQSSATRMVDWLVQGGFVERASDPGDRRIVRVRMTDSGRAFYRASTDYTRRRISSLLAGFSPEEQQVLLQLMSKLLHAMAAEQ